jgi:hypothetical protein
MKRTGFCWLRIGYSGGLCEHGTELSGSIKKAGYCFTSCVTSKNILHHGVSE